MDILRKKVRRVHIGTHGKGVHEVRATLFAEPGREIVFSYQPNSEHDSPLGRFTTNDGVLTVSIQTSALLRGLRRRRPARPRRPWNGPSEVACWTSHASRVVSVTAVHGMACRYTSSSLTASDQGCCGSVAPSFMSPVRRTAPAMVYGKG